jgi:hypothetical protein
MSRQYITPGGAFINETGQRQYVSLAGFANETSSILLTTLVLENTSVSATPSNFIPNMFGHPFKKGDIPAGTYPLFKLTDGTPVPYSIFNQAYWSDGSLKLAGFLIRVPTSLAGASQITINILNGGNAPIASTLDENDLSAGGLDLRVSINGLNAALLSGTWVSILNNGISNTNQSYPTGGPDIVDFGGGPVGKIWRIRASFEQSGSPHGQLECYWYVAALENAAGGLYGIRYLGRVCQPWYDVNSPSKDYRPLDTFEVLDGATQLRDCMGATMGPVNSDTFSWQVGSTTTVTLSGATTVQSGQLIRVTTTNTLPPPLLANTDYFIYRTSTTKAAISTTSTGAANNGSKITLTGAGAGTHTLTPYPFISHFGSLWTCGPTAVWDYVQGAGSISADVSVRVRMNSAYWRSTKMVPPYDLSINPTAAASSQSWSLNTHGPLPPDVNRAGEHDWIGVLPAWSVRHFYKQTPNDESYVRVVGLIGGTFSVLLRNSGNKKIPVVNNTNYPNMPTGSPTFRWDTSNASGIGTPPTSTARIQCFNSQDTSHIADYSYYAYLFTGEPQYLDNTIEWGNSAVYQRATNVGTAVVSPTQNTIGAERNSNINGNAYYGYQLNNSNILRGDAWAMRDVAKWVAIMPASYPDCDAQYPRDLCETTWNAGLAFNAIQTTFWNTNGLWQFRNPGDVSSLGASGAPWCNGYWFQANAFAYAVTEISDALTILNHTIKYAGWASTLVGAWGLASYRDVLRNGTANDSPIITSDAQYAVINSTITWGAPPTTIFTKPASASTYGYAPDNNDIYIFGGTSAPSGFSTYTPYYVVNVSGTQFELAASIGGSAITNLSAAGSRTALIQPHSGNIPTTPSNNALSASSYLPNIWAGLNYATAVGATLNSDTTNARDALEANWNASTLTFVSDPKYAMTTTF